MTHLTVTVDDAVLRARLDGLTRRITAPEQLLDDIGAVLEARVQRRFDFKRDPNGEAWDPWAPATARQRRREGRGELLHHGGKRSQHLRETLNHRVGVDFVAVGFGATYAQYHEFGTKRMRRRGLLTADPLAGTLGEEDRRLILQTVVNHLQREML